MSSREKNDQLIANAIKAHARYKSSWKKQQTAFSVGMVSPRGKEHTCLSADLEIEAHLARTVQKIREILESEAA